MTSASLSPLAWLLDGQPELGKILPALERASASPAPLLIVGEPGTGRTTLARAAHAASPRAEAPLVAIDPSTVPSGLFESDLFGYRPGAFSGAGEGKKGRVERADGGTLLLDPVEELPLVAQPKLLRLVAEGVYTPLGGRERRADLRFLTVGPEDLRARVVSGAFREDLYYRLEVLAVRIPPLRERPADLPGVVARLLADLGERFGRPRPALSPRAREWILRHPWPGNIRQLRNTLERALVMTTEGEALDPPPAAGGQGAEERPCTLAAVEEEAIRRALAYCRGHQGRAAELLGISRKALWAKRRRLGIP